MIGGGHVAKADRLGRKLFDGISTTGERYSQIDNVPSKRALKRNSKSSKGSKSSKTSKASRMSKASRSYGHKLHSPGDRVVSLSMFRVCAV